MCHSPVRLGSIILLILLSAAVVTAQATCAPLIEEALATVDDNCEGLDRNSACYGFNEVEALFINTMPEAFFSQPSDVARLIDLEMLTTSALDETDGTWGVALMSIQAQLPDTLPGQNVLFILLGDTEVENAVDPADSFSATAAIEVTTALESNVRSGPGLNFNIVERVPQGTKFPADGRSSDGNWVRVVHNDRILWMHRDVLRENGAIADLPLLTPDLRSPMQAFYLRTGIGESTCAAAPDDMLLVQGPEDIEIDLTINGANIRMGSTVAFRLLAENLLEIFVIDGHVELLDDNFEPTGFIIQAGQRSLACLSPPESRGLDGESNDRIVSCAFSKPEWVNRDIIGGEWCILQNVPSDILNYPVDLDCPGELLPTPIPPTPTPVPPPPRTVVVPTEDVCAGFGLIGPISGITPRPTVFQWTPAPNATDYEIVFYDFNGNLAQTFFTQQTSIELNVGQIPTGSALSWEVRAYENGNYLCVTSRTPQSARLPDPLPPPPVNFRVSQTSCDYNFRTGTYTVTVSWRGLPAGDTLTVTLREASSGKSSSTNGGGSSGSLQGSLNTYKDISVTVTTSGGEQVSLPGCSAAALG